MEENSRFYAINNNGDIVNETHLGERRLDFELYLLTKSKVHSIAVTGLKFTLLAVPRGPYILNYEEKAYVDHCGRKSGIESIA